MLDDAARHGRRLGLEVATVRADAERLPFADRELRPRLRPRRPAPHPRPRSGPSPSSAGCCGPAERSPSAASPRATATARRRCPSAPGCSRRRSGGALVGASARGWATAARARTATSSSPRSTSTPSRPRELRGAAATTPASRTCGSAARSCWRTPTAGCCARSRRPPSRTRSRWRWRALRLPQLPRAAARRRGAARAATCRPSSSTTSSSAPASPA